VLGRGGSGLTRTGGGGVMRVAWGVGGQVNARACAQCKRVQAAVGAVRQWGGKGCGVGCAGVGVRVRWAACAGSACGAWCGVGARRVRRAGCRGVKASGHVVEKGAGVRARV